MYVSLLAVKLDSEQGYNDKFEIEKEKLNVLLTTLL